MNKRPIWNALSNPMGSPESKHYARTPSAIATHSAPEALPPPPHRDINADETREITFKPFTLQNNGVNPYTDEIIAVSLSRPHSAVDVFLTLASYNGQVTIPPGTFLEVAVTVYAVVGQLRVPVSRGCYYVEGDGVAAIPLGGQLQVATARVGAERFDVGVRLGTAGTFTTLIGVVGAIGYDAPATPAFQNLHARGFVSGFATTNALVAARRSQLFKVKVTNGATSVAGYCLFFDRTSGVAIANGARAYENIFVPAGPSETTFDFTISPREFFSGIFWQTSSTPGTMTAAGAPTLLTVMPEWA